MIAAPVPAASAAALLRLARRYLLGARVACAQNEPEWILGHLLGLSPTELCLHEGFVAQPLAERFLKQIQQRAEGAPLQYLLGEAHFFGRPFKVKPGVFIPRPETEAVLEVVLGRLRVLEERLGRPLLLLELGTGSGAIAITLARLLPTCRVAAIEVSWTALQTAAGNSRRHGVASRVQLVGGFWMEALRPGVLFDAVISNPPYVPSAEVDRLSLDVRQEPRQGLDGGADGLRDIRRLIEASPRVLSPGGVLALECGEGHVGILQKQTASLPWVGAVEPIFDLAERPRAILLVRKTDS